MIVGREMRRKPQGSCKKSEVIRLPRREIWLGAGDDAIFMLLLDTYDAHQQCDQQGASVRVPSADHLTVEQLGLPEPLATTVREAMKQRGQDSLRKFVRDALKRESNTQLGLAWTKKQRSQQHLDVSQVPTSTLDVARSGTSR